MEKVKVRVVEEVSPNCGYAEDNIWNPPPALKGLGRYRIINNVIKKEDFRDARAKYWDRDFLEEMDMFCTIPGWRITGEGIEILRSKGYEIEIDTILVRDARKESN